MGEEGEIKQVFELKTRWARAMGWNPGRVDNLACIIWNIDKFTWPV